MTYKKWERALVARFAHRECVPDAELYDRFWKETGCAERDVLRALQVLEDEFGVNVGLLRPEDEFEKFTDPVSTRNPLRSLFFWLLSQDSTSEVAWELKKRLRSRHVQLKRGTIRTLSDYVRAWCGNLERDQVLGSDEIHRSG